MNLLIGLRTCSTCKEIEKFLREADIDYIYQDVRENCPSNEQLQEIISYLGSDKIDFLVNVRGNVFREENLKEIWSQLSVDEKRERLSENGMLIKRPIFVTEDKQVLIGTKEIKELENANE